VAGCRANDSRKIVSPVFAAILRIRRDVKRTMPEQGSSKRGGNDELRPCESFITSSARVRDLSATIEFQDSSGVVESSAKERTSDFAAANDPRINPFGTEKFRDLSSLVTDISTTIAEELKPSPPPPPPPDKLSRFNFVLSSIRISISTRAATAERSVIKYLPSPGTDSPRMYTER